MVGGIFYEHGHRLIATTVGFLTIGLVIILWVVEKRRWMRRLGLIALAAVIVQGVLGGLTVKYFLPPPISIGHAGLAQIFFCLTISIALFTSRGWRIPKQSAVDDEPLRRRAKWLVGLVYVQILLGATMRHTGAGLAIPDFPLMFGQLVPPHWTLPIAIHFAHRVGALVVTVACLLMARELWRRFGSRTEFSRPAWILVCAVLTQVTLGAFVVLSGKDPVINTLHVATGAIVLGTSVLIALRAHRVRFHTVTA
jgi:cytochrome c oxidase assembly protein subunit 15